MSSDQNIIRGPDTAWNKPKSFRWSLPGDGQIMRGLFYLMLAAIAVGVFHDYRDLASKQTSSVKEPLTFERPVLPPQIFDAPQDGSPQQKPPEVSADPETLRQPLSILLTSGNVLKLTGKIDVGSAVRFRDQISQVGEYVKRIELNSPGGSVRDALAISSLIREKGYATFVENKALCASSCPLILAGGKERLAGDLSAVGVHQVFTGRRTGTETADAEVSNTQRVTADITRHLETMGVDPALWLHALDTPPNRLYYLSIDEMRKYGLITDVQTQ